MHALARTAIALATTIAPCTAHGQEVKLLQSGTSSRVTGMAADAKLICGTGQYDGYLGNQAAIWDDHGDEIWAHLTTYGVKDRVCTGISSDGRFAIGSGYDPVKQCGGAMYWDRATATAFCLPQSWGGKPNAITLDGRMIAGTDMGQAILWIDGQRYFLGASTFHSETTGITPDGSVAVGYLSSSYEAFDAFVWDRDQGLSLLPTFGAGASASAMAINADGTVIVGYCGWIDNGWLARWTRDSVTGQYIIERLGTDDQTTLFSFEYPDAAVSPDGSVITGSLLVEQQHIASETVVVWTQRTGMRPVRDLVGPIPGGLILLGIRGIAADNRTIAGNGWLSNEYGEDQVLVGWLATLPCPADFDESSFVDTDDYDAFIAAFESDDSLADVDGSGFVDTDDFNAFVHAFIEGC